VAHRFYAPAASQTGLLVRLPDTEGAHLHRVLRLKAGADVRVFDGQGHEFSGTVLTVDRTGVTIETLQPIVPVREPRVAITLAQAVLTGRKFDTVVRDAVMLGVSAVCPLVTAHTDVPDAALHGESARQRWERIAVASAKQSGRAVVPVIGSPISIDRHLSDAAGELNVLLVEPGADPSCSRLDALASRPPPRHATVALGPEGGWSEGELNDARTEGWTLVTLGARTLRADAVPVAAVSLLLYIWGEL